MKIYKISTTAFEEEDFLVLTDLSQKQITDVISPIVEAERREGKYYDNDDLYHALTKAYPLNPIEFYYDQYIQEVTI